MDADNRVPRPWRSRTARSWPSARNDEIQRLAARPPRVIDLRGRTALPGLDRHPRPPGQRRGARRRGGRGPRLLRPRRSARRPTSGAACASGRAQAARRVDRRAAAARCRTSAWRRAACRRGRSWTRRRRTTRAYVTFGAHVIVANSAGAEAKGVDARHARARRAARSSRTRAPASRPACCRERAQYLVKHEAGVTPEALAEGISLELERCLQRGVTRHPRHHHQPRGGAGLPGARPARTACRCACRWSCGVIESNFQKKSLLDLGLVHGLRLGLAEDRRHQDEHRRRLHRQERRLPQAAGHRRRARANPGLIRIKQDELDETVWRCTTSVGMRCCVHAIGDMAMDMILEAYREGDHPPAAAGPPPPRRAPGQLDDDARADGADEAAGHPADGQPAVPLLPGRSADRDARASAPPSRASRSRACGRRGSRSASAPTRRATSRSTRCATWAPPPPTRRSAARS